MNEWTVFLTLGTILAFVGTMYSMFYKPTHELKIEIVKLNSNLETLKDSDKSQNKRIKASEESINKIKLDVSTLKTDVKYIKDRI